MQDLGDHLFADARGPRQQGRDVNLRDTLDEGEHGLAHRVTEHHLFPLTS